MTPKELAADFLRLHESLKAQREAIKPAVEWPGPLGNEYAWWLFLGAIMASPSWQDMKNAARAMEREQ